MKELHDALAAILTYNRFMSYDGLVESLDPRFANLNLVATDLFYCVPNWIITEPGKIAVQVKEKSFYIEDGETGYETNYIAVKDYQVYTSKKVYKLRQMPSVFRNNSYLALRPSTVDEFITNYRGVKMPQARYLPKKSELSFLLASVALNISKSLANVIDDEDELFLKIDQVSSFFANSFVESKSLQDKADIIQVLGNDGLPSEVAVAGLGFNKLISRWSELAVYDYVFESVCFHLNGRVDTILPYDLGGRLMQPRGLEDDDLSMARL